MRLRRKYSEATGRSHAYNQADEWASQLCNKESLSATDRSTRYRQRKRALAAGKVPIPRLVAGRKPMSGYASSDTAKRRRQRARLAARTNLAEYLAHFRRLRVILKTSLNTCSDFRRMARLSAEPTRAKASATQRTAILLCDRCWRDARISRANSWKGFRPRQAIRSLYAKSQGVREGRFAERLNDLEQAMGVHDVVCNVRRSRSVNPHY